MALNQWLGGRVFCCGGCAGAEELEGGGRAAAYGDVSGVEQAEGGIEDGFGGGCGGWGRGWSRRGWSGRRIPSGASSASG